MNVEDDGSEEGELKDDELNYDGGAGDVNIDDGDSDVNVDDGDSDTEEDRFVINTETEDTEAEGEMVNEILQHQDEESVDSEMMAIHHKLSKNDGAGDGKSDDLKTLSEKESKKINFSKQISTIKDVSTDNENENSERTTIMVLDEGDEIEDNIDDDDDACKIDWQQTAVIPKPHLFTEAMFNQFCSPQRLNIQKINICEQILKEQRFSQSKQKSKNADDQNNQKTEKKSLIENTFKLKTKYHLTLMEPKPSRISPGDRYFYMKYMEHVTKKNNDKFLRQHEDRFKEMSRIVRQEQSEYTTHLYQCFMANPAEYFFINQQVKQFIKNNNMERIKGLLAEKKRCFSLKQTINMKQVQNNPQIKFDFLGECAKQQDKINRLHIPALHTTLMENGIPQSPKFSPSPFNPTQLCEEKRCPMFAHQDALLAIMESLAIPTREWLIPVHIDYNKNLGRSVIRIEEPLPRRNIAIREANRIFYQNNFLKASQTNNVNMFSCGSHRILIESSVDASEEENYQQTFSVNAKIELQPSIGFETFSILDLCHMWWSSKLANTSQIACCRIDPRNDMLRKIEYYTRAMLCGPGCPYNPHYFYSQLNYLCDILCTAQPGRYVLEHASGNAFFFLFEEKEKGFTTFETKYKDLLSNKNELIMTNQVSAAWLPLDTNIPRNVDGIPCLFSPNVQKQEFIALGKRAKTNKKSGKKRKHSDKKLVSPISTPSQKFEDDLLHPGTEDETRSPVFKDPISYGNSLDELF
eukprot:TCONS_00010249-protein